MESISRNASAVNLFVEYWTVQIVIFDASAVDLFVEYWTVQIVKFEYS